MNYSQILKKAYKLFILDVEGKKVAVPYRINIPPAGHPARQGKSSPEVILKQLYTDAEKEGFNLKTATVLEIREFMESHKLGIDCSGFAYRMLDFLVGELGMGDLQKVGFPHVGKTNVGILTSEKFSNRVTGLNQAQPGDLIKFNSDKDIPHCVLILEKNGDEIIYAHSSDGKKLNGVHIGRIFEGKFEGELLNYKFNESHGDGIWRLKILS